MSENLSQSQISPRRTLARNLALLVLSGVLTSCWIWWKTDWFAEFAEALALGGVFSWIAFVSRILTEERVGELQTWAEEAILLNPRTTKFLVRFIASAAAIFGLLVGTVQVESFDAIDRPVEIARSGHSETKLSKFGDLERAHPGVPLRAVFATTWWWKSLVRVKVIGYPAREVEVRPWLGARLHVPGSFLGGAVLVVLSDNLLNQRLSISGQIQEEDHKPIPLTPFESDRHSFWVGDGAATEIAPAQKTLMESWLGGVPAERAQFVKGLWFNPDKGLPAILRDGQKLWVWASVIDGGEASNKAVACEAIVIRSPESYVDYPLILRLVDKNKC